MTALEIDLAATDLCRLVWNRRVGHRRQPRSSATPSSAVAGVEDAVKGGRSPAKRTLEGVRNANTLKGLGLVAAFRGQRPSPSGGRGLHRPRGRG
jgi:hypothetical protein